MFAADSSGFSTCRFDRWFDHKWGKEEDPSNPMLVSIRSGAVISMPGMMDTILNLGINQKVADGITKIHELGVTPALEPKVRSLN